MLGGWGQRQTDPWTVSLASGWATSSARDPIKKKKKTGSRIIEASWAKLPCKLWDTITQQFPSLWFLESFIPLFHAEPYAWSLCCKCIDWGWTIHSQLLGCILTSCGFLYWPPTAARGSFFDKGGSQCYLWIDYNCGDLGLTNDLHVPSSQFGVGYDFF